MSDGETPWVDPSRCTGCATCVGVCPLDAISIMNNKAHIDGESCTGCGACVDSCPEGAIQFVLEGEIVPVQEQPVPAVPRPSPVVEAAGAAVVATGTALLRKAGEALAHGVERWLTHVSAASEPFPGDAGDTGAGVAADAKGSRRAGHRARHRRRGR